MVFNVRIHADRHCTKPAKEVPRRIEFSGLVGKRRPFPLPPCPLAAGNIIPKIFREIKGISVARTVSLTR